MDRVKGLTPSRACFLFFFFFTTTIIFCPQLGLSNEINVADNGDGGQNNVDTNKDEKPSILAMVTDTFGLLSRSQISSWDKLKSLLNQLQLHFSPPNLDFRSRDMGESREGEGDSAGGRMKEAAEESAKSAAAVVEESAKSAAKAVGDAVQMTTEKLKETVISNQQSDAEL